MFFSLNEKLFSAVAWNKEHHFWPRPELYRRAKIVRRADISGIEPVLRSRNDRARYTRAT